MNNDRRNEIHRICNKLNNLMEELNSVCEDEQFAFDNMPENLQGSERGMASEDALDAMDSAMDHLSEAWELLDDIE